MFRVQTARQGRRPFLVVSLCVVVALAASHSTAHAVDLTYSSDIANLYKNGAAQVASKALNYAAGLFWALAAIQFAASSIRLGLQGADFQEWSAHLVRQILFIGIYAWIMENSYTFGTDIIDSFIDVAYNSTSHANGAFDAGLKIANAMYSQVKAFHPIDAIVFGIGSLITVAAFAWVSALIVVALCESYVLVGAGVILAGFGGSEWTRDIANKSLMLAVSAGAKVYMMYTVTNIGWSMIYNLSNQTYADSTSVFSTIGAILVFVYIVFKLPEMLSAFISGAVSGSTAAEGIKQVTQAAAMAAIGGAGVAAASGALGAGAQSAMSSLGQSVGGAHGGAGAAGAGAAGAGDAARAAQIGGTGGAGASGSGSAGRSTASPAARAGAALGQVGRAVAQNAYGRMTGTGIHGGTLAGRLSAYMVRNNAPPPPQAEPPPTSENTVS